MAPVIRIILTNVVIFDNIEGRFLTRPTKPISWIRAAKRDFEKFPGSAQERCLDALTIAAEGGKSDIAKPMHGMGSGIFEIALPHHRMAFRMMYAVQLGDELWVLHAFQKKSRRGVSTPKAELDLVKERLKRLKEALG